MSESLPDNGIQPEMESSTDGNHVNQLDPVNLTVTSATSLGSILVTDVPDGRGRNMMQSVEFSPTLTKASFHYNGSIRKSSSEYDEKTNSEMRSLSQQMLTIYLQHIGNALYFMFVMALGFTFSLINALSYGQKQYHENTHQFEIFMIMVNGASILILSVVVIRLTLRKSDEDHAHGEGLNFFLRIGAIIFCIGVIILNILRAIEPLEIWLLHGCTVPIRPTHTTFHVLSVIFYSMQTYFMFKYHKTSFLSGPRQQKTYIIQLSLIRFAMMHLVAVNLVHWLNSIMWEAVELFEEANHVFQNSTHSYGSHNYSACESSTVLKASSKQAQSYLFPCVIEYSLIAAGALLAMYVRVSYVENHRIIRKFTCPIKAGPFVYHVTEASEQRPESPSGDDRTDLENITVQTQNMTDVFPASDFRKEMSRRSNSLQTPKQDFDTISQCTTATTAAINRAMGCSQPNHRRPRICEKSHVGFFFGLMLLAGSIVYIATEFIFMKKIKTTPSIKSIFQLIWSAHYVLGLGLTIYLIVRLTTTFRYEFRISITMEKLLLYVTYFGNLIFIVLSLIADIDNLIHKKSYTELLRVVVVFTNCAQILQQTVQAVFVFYGLNLRANSKRQRKLKPGRTALTITIFLNMMIWLHESLLMKSYIIAPQYISFYGLLPWCMISSACFPLIIFFRFHSASLLAEIWSRAYD